jgi:putative NIF3 family GTP cyclohydrolase 1 type 2
VQILERGKKLRGCRYPEELADRSWDNVGLLLENIKSDKGSPRVLVTNDLTISVAEEAIQRKVSVIVSYRESWNLLSTRSTA